jgi:hypothetical protein
MTITDNIVCVISYFDEDHEVPVDYVMRWKADDFEAFVCKIENNTIDSVTIGHFPTEEKACAAIYAWNALNNYGFGGERSKAN